MTDKRFIIMDNLPKGTHSRIWDKQKQHNQGIGDELWLGEVVAMLNEGVTLAEENEHLKKELHKLKLVNEMLSMDFSNSEHELWRENEQLKQQLYCNPDDGVCSICKHQHLTESIHMQGYYTAKCEKGHEECSKETLRHCKDFKFKELEE